MTQLMYPRDKAHEALDAFLSEGGDGPFDRWIADEKGEPLAYIVPAGRYDALGNGYREWAESQEVREDDDLPPGYRPFLDSPLNMGGDRLLPHEPFHEPIARYAFGKPYAELDERDQHRVNGAAITCVLRTTLDPDGNGAVPILMLGHDRDEPGPGLRWQIACKTSVHGLYLRATPAIFGDEWTIVTGSGYRLAAGWLSREDATATVEALGRTLPNMDWMRVSRESFTPKAQAAIKAVFERYHRFGRDEDKPEPEIMTEAIPDSPEVPAPETAEHGAA